MDKLEIEKNEIVKQLLVYKKERCPQSARWHLRAVYWDDGDYEFTLCTCWGFISYNFVYRYSTNRYYYYEETLKKSLLEMKEIA